METDDEIITLAERRGFENLRERLATGDMLLQQADRLLGLLLAGVGGALALGRTVFNAPSAPEHVWGAAAVAVYWAIVAVVLLRRCIMTRNTQVLYNEPKNIYRPDSDWSLRKLRAAELALLQERIELTKRRNTAIADALDGCRLAAVAAPAVFAIAALVVAACR